MRKRQLQGCSVLAVLLGTSGCFTGEKDEPEADAGTDSTSGSLTESGSQSSGDPTTAATDSSTSVSSSDPTTETVTATTTSATDPTSTTDPTGATDSSADSSGGCVPGTEGCACDGGGCDDGLTCFEDVCADLGALNPLPPDGDTFMWQNIQTAFEYDSGDACTGRITVAVSDQAACYVDSSNELQCAGRVFDTVFGDTFAGTGQMNVDQVFIRPTFNASNGNGMCILRDGQILCFGRNNNFGVYGNGTTDDVANFTQWGNLGSIVRMATGTWDQLCGLTEGGDIHCSGNGYAITPMLVQAGGGDFWVNTFGDVVAPPGDAWRASQGRAACQIRPAGLTCSGSNFGPATEIVDGGAVQGAGGVDARCWLTTGKEVQCTGTSQITYFESGRVLAFAYHFYTDSMCAVLDDASLWCWGSNQNGKLGTGDTANVVVETEVAPPGSVRIECQ